MKCTHRLLSFSRSPASLPTFCSEAGTPPYRPTAAMIEWIKARIAARSTGSEASASPRNSLEIPQNFQLTATPYVPSHRPVNQNAQQPFYQLNPQQTAFFDLIDCEDTIAAHFNSRNAAPSSHFSPKTTSIGSPALAAQQASSTPIASNPDEIDIDIDADAEDSCVQELVEPALETAAFTHTDCLATPIHNPEEIDLDLE